MTIRIPLSNFEQSYIEFTESRLALGQAPSHEDYMRKMGWFTPEQVQRFQDGLAKKGQFKDGKFERK